MVEVTIKTEFEEDGAVCVTEHKMPPCGLAFVACVSSGDEEEAYQGSSAIVGGYGMDMCESAGLLAEMTVKALEDMADGQKNRRELLFGIYLNTFLAGIDGKSRRGKAGNRKVKSRKGEKDDTYNNSDRRRKRRFQDKNGRPL